MVSSHLRSTGSARQAVRVCANNGKQRSKAGPGSSEVCTSVIIEPPVSLEEERFGGVVSRQVDVVYRLLFHVVVAER